MMNERFDPYTARKVMGPIGVGATVGGVLGGGMAYLAARSLPLPSMLLSVALLDLLALLLLRRLPRRSARSPPRAPARLPRWRRPCICCPPCASCARICCRPHLAWLVGLGALVESLLDYTFNAQAAAHLQGASLASFFAAYQAGVSVLGFLAQSFLARAALDSLGLAGTVGLRPLAVAVSSLAALLDPRLLSLLLARGAHAVLTASLFRSAYELLFTPVPTDRKRPTKAIIDVGFDKLGSVAGGLVALAVVSLVPGEAARILLGVVRARGPPLPARDLVAPRRVRRRPRAEPAFGSSTPRTRRGEGRHHALLLYAGHGRAVLDRSEAGPCSRGSGVADDPLLAAIADLRSGRALPHPARAGPRAVTPTPISSPS